jgi:hypothetical protein
VKEKTSWAHRIAKSLVRIQPKSMETLGTTIVVNPKKSLIEKNKK